MENPNENARKFSTKNRIIISFLSLHQKFLLLELTKAIEERGCEILQCHLHRLADHDAGILQVQGNWAAIAKLELVLPVLAERFKIALQMQRAYIPELPEDCQPYDVEVVGPCQTKLVSQCIRFFEERRAEVWSIENLPYQSNFSETPMTTLRMIVLLPLTVGPADVRDEFIDLCNKIGVDGIIAPNRN